MSHHRLTILEDDIGFPTMTAVQAATVPLLMSHKDVVVQAKTGSGKTLAFLVPTLAILLREKALGRGPLADSDSTYASLAVGAIILAPTRELATQIYTVASSLIAKSSSSSSKSSSSKSSSSSSSGNKRKGLRLSCVLFTGGSPVEDDLARVERKGGNVVVATPGRLLDLMDSDECLLNWKALEVLILDEADMLLDLGFENDLASIINRLPKQRRTGLFSATQTSRVDDLARAGLRNPVAVHVAVKSKGSSSSSSSSSSSKKKGGSDEQSTPTSLSNTYQVFPDNQSKAAGLLALLRGIRDRIDHAAGNLPPKVIVYFLTCAQVEYMDVLLAGAFPDEFSNHTGSIGGGGKKKKKKKKKNGEEGGPERIPIFALSGRMKQTRRQKTMKAFRNASVGVLFATDVAARGIDMSDVSWVVQYDPPKEADMFVHRVGRTARLGRTGSAVIFLLESEKGYADFVKVRGSPLAKLRKVYPELGRSVKSAPAVWRELQEAGAEDRAVYEAGMRAFVSFVRGYKGHTLSFYFVFSKLDCLDLAASFGLVHVPSMPELRGTESHAFTLDSGYSPRNDLEPIDIAYADRAREEARQARKERDAEAAASRKERQIERREKRAANAPWSKQKAKRAAKQERKRKKAVAADAKAERIHDSLAEKAALLRALKAGDLLPSEFEAALLDLEAKGGEVVVDEVVEDEDEDDVVVEKEDDVVVEKEDEIVVEDDVVMEKEDGDEMVEVKKGKKRSASKKGKKGRKGGKKRKKGLMGKPLKSS